MDTGTVETQDAQRKPRIFYGWWIVLVAFLSDLMQGATFYAFPVFYKPMAESLGWSRTTVAIAPTLRTFIGAFISPAIGWLVDRRGPRAIMVIGAILMGISSMAMAGIGEVWQYMLVYGVLGSLAMITRGPLVTLVTVSKWFIRKRGRAMAFVTIGVSLGGLVITPLATYLVGEYSWRVGWFFLGIATWVVLIPSALVMRRQPEDMGLLPDGAEPAIVRDLSAGSFQAAPEEGRRAEDIEEDWTLHQAFRSPTFWLIIMAFNLGSLSISSVMLHQFNYITDKGFSSTTAAGVVSMYAFLAIIAKLIYGFVSERVHIRYLVIFSMVGGGIAIAILNVATTWWALYIYAFVYGLTRGAYILVMPLAWANYFGRTFQGTIRGVATPFNVVTSAGGPLFGAWVYDNYGSYSLAFTFFSFTFLLGAFLMFLAKPTKPPKLSSPQSPDRLSRTSAASQT